MSVIYCNIDTFSRVSNILIKDDEGNEISSYSCPIDKVPEILPELCYSNNSEIHFLGNEKYIEGIVESIKTEQKTKYNLENLKYKIN